MASGAERQKTQVLSDFAAGEREREREKGGQCVCERV